MESLDPFYNPEEEALARAQSARNANMRNSLRSRISVSEDRVGDEGSNEFIKVSDESATGANQGSVKPAPWMPPFGYPPYDNCFLRLHQEMLDFTRWVSLTPMEYKRRESFVHRLNGVCKSIWPRSRVVPFGSFLTGLSLPSSDVDVSIIHVPAEHDELGEIGCLRKLANRLLEEQQVSFVELRESAKIPILRLKDRDPPFCEIDINLNSEAPQATSNFILRNAIEKYPQFRPLVLLIKCFLYQRNLADTFTGGVGSYLLSCLVLAFLQQHGITFQSRTAELTSLGHLLFDFFDFYARLFRGDREGLSVRRGGARFPKSSRHFDLPTVAYTSRRSLPTSDALCVESPLEPDLDIGNKVFQWKMVKSAFMQARQVLIDEAQSYDALNGMKSLIASNLVDASHAMFERSFEDLPTPACPLSAQALSFRGRSDSVPPSPYSDEEIDLDAQEAAKRRRHSEDAYRRMHPPDREYRGNRIVFESDESTGSGRKRHRY